jgi:hypothetical protein
VNNQGIANSVVGYSVSSTGSLTELPGSPYATGGIGTTGTCQGLDRIITSAANNLLFVSNGGDQTIGVFQINPADGSLSAAPGSPFASGLTLDSCQGISLAATPDGSLLMAAGNGKIQSFAVAPNGVLTKGPLTTNCCSPTVGMKISAIGNLLALSNESSVSVYSINPDGSLVAATGSPFPLTGTGVLSGIDFSCAADRLYGVETSFAATITDAWSIAAGGALLPITGSPFIAPAGGSGSLVLSPDNSKLFTNNPFTSKIQSYSLDLNGSVHSIGAFGPLNSVHTPMGLATDLAGRFLFAADDTVGVAVFSVAATGTLSPATNVAINRVGTVQGLAAYPPRSCVSGDLALTISASPTTVEAGSNVTYTLTLTNNGTSSASATIVDNLPTGASFVSCSAPGGSCSLALPNPHTFVYTGIAAGASVTATLVAATDANLLNGATVSNTASIGNKSVIDTNPANDTATATINITAQPGATTLTVSPTSASYGGLAVLTATLQKKLNGALIIGKTISFSLNGTPVGTAITNNVGQASLTTSVAGIPLGAYTGAIGASFAGDPQFNASTGSGNLTINKAVLTVVANSVAKLYLDPNPPFTYSISGFLNGDTAAVVSGSTTCNTVVPTDASTPAGRYAIHCPVGTLAAANYTFTTLDGVLIVNKPPLTVVIDNATRVYGDPDPLFTGTITGLRGTDVITATYSTTATASSPVGTYAIVPNFIDPAGVLGNYNVILTQGILTITPASLTFNVDSTSRVYGDPNPAFTGSILGIKNSDNITATYSTPATPTSSVGTYPIIGTLVDPTQKLRNYTVTINNGTLTITPAPLTVTAANASRLYGDPNPAFTGTIVGIKNADPITATYSSPATATTDIGTYPIVPALVDPALKLGNYSVTIINGTLTITPAPLSVTVNNATRQYGNANPAFTSTVVGIKNADVITVSYSTVDATANVGTYPIVPSISGTKAFDYTLIAHNGTLTITKAPLTLTGFSGSRVYGDPNPAPTVAGLKNADPITFGYSAASPTSTSPIGNYTIVPAVVSDPQNKLPNYTLTLVNGTMTINQAQFTITAASFSRAYGSPNPTFTGTFSGANTVTPIATVLANDGITYSFSTTATQKSNAGSFAITIAVSDPNKKLANYKVTQVNGTLTITQVPLTVTATNQTIILGSTTWACSTGTAPATATPSCVSYSGFVQNGVVNDGPANLSGNVSCTLSNGTGNIGTFANGITCGGLTSTNYSFTFVKATYNTQYEPLGFNCTNGPGHVILAPINAGGSSTFTKSTTPTVAVQFRVCDAKGTSISSAVVSSFVLTSVNGVPASTPAPQGGPFAFVGGTLANGAGSAGWQFNLSTSNLTAGNTYAYKINLNDGTSITFQFKLQ